jgi:hypothetical protein
MKLIKGNIYFVLDQVEAEGNFNYDEERPDLDDWGGRHIFVPLQKIDCGLLVHVLMKPSSICQLVQL